MYILASYIVDIAIQLVRVINKIFQIPKCNSESASIRYGSDFYTVNFIGHWAMLLVVQSVVVASSINNVHKYCC